MAENSVMNRIFVLFMTAGRATKIFEEDTNTTPDRRYF